MAYCKIATQLNQTLLGITCHYKDLVQCQSRNRQHDILAPIYKMLKKKFYSTSNVKYNFVFYSDNIKRYVSIG